MHRSAVRSNLNYSERIDYSVWRGGRAVECTGLENRQGLVALRGFESHPLRHTIAKKMTAAQIAEAESLFQELQALD